MAGFGRRTIKAAVLVVAGLGMSGALAFAQDNVVEVWVYEGIVMGGRAQRAGGPRGGIEVNVNTIGEGGATVTRGRSDGSGRITLSGLADGMYEVVASSTSECSAVEAQLVQLGPGHAQAEVTIVVDCSDDDDDEAQDGNVLNVQVYEGNVSGDRIDSHGDPRGGIEVIVNSMSLDGEPVGRGTSDDDGRISFPGLDDGFFQIVATETRDCTPLAGPLVQLGPGRTETQEAFVVVECDFSFLFALLPVALVDPSVDSP